MRISWGKVLEPDPPFRTRKKPQIRSVFSILMLRQLTWSPNVSTSLFLAFFFRLFCSFLGGCTKLPLFHTHPPNGFSAQLPPRHQTSGHSARARLVCPRHAGGGERQEDAEGLHWWPAGGSETICHKKISMRAPPALHPGLKDTRKEVKHPFFVRL